MAKRAEDTVVACELCGVVGELRPYGEGERKICFECWQKDPAGRDRMMAVLETVFQWDKDAGPSVRRGRN